MIYANDEIFNISYNVDIDRLQIMEDKKKSKIKNNIQKSKVMSILAAVFIAFCCLNCVLIYTFMDLLKKL